MSEQTGTYNAFAETYDWRYSAAILGLQKYLEYNFCDYELTDHSLAYNEEDITEEQFLEYAEYFYGDEFLHVFVEELLRNETVSDDQKKLINEKLTGNVAMKKVFGKLRFDGENRQEILELIQKERLFLIKETFRNKSNMYANFANRNQLFEPAKGCCRLNGYYIDAGKKGKSISYNFDQNTYVGTDDLIFDFIPFAFTKGTRDFFFINENYSVEDLEKTNSLLEREIAGLADESGRQNPRKVLFHTIIKNADFIKYDVEVIYKNREQDFFETIYIRKQAVDILLRLGERRYKSLCFSYKINENYYIDIQKETVERILNSVYMDDLIQLLLKDDSKGDRYSYTISSLIAVNMMIRKGGRRMKESAENARKCGKRIKKAMEKNKVTSYSHKLTNAVVFNDESRVCEILLQMANTVNMEFGFAYDVFEDFESNKDLVYVFINALKDTYKNEAEDN